MAVSEYAMFQANGCSLNIQQVIQRPLVAVLCFGGHSLGYLWNPWLGREDLVRYGVSEHHFGPVVPVHDVYLPNWKWNVPTGQRFLSQGSNCVGVVPGKWCWIPANVQSSNTTKTQYLEFAWPLLKHQVQSISGYLLRTYGVHSKAGCNYVDRWS